MSRLRRGYCGIGVVGVKNELNIGGLWRSAHAFGADFIFTVGARYRPQGSDTSDAGNHVPLWHFHSWDEFLVALPNECHLVAVEILDNARDLASFVHPERAVYVLGGEDRTLGGEITQRCEAVVRIPTSFCLNVASAGTIVLYDRFAKRG